MSQCPASPGSRNAAPHLALWGSWVPLHSDRCGLWTHLEPGARSDGQLQGWGPKAGPVALPPSSSHLSLPRVSGHTQRQVKKMSWFHWATVPAVTLLTPGQETAPNLLLPLPNRPEPEGCSCPAYPPPSCAQFRAATRSKAHQPPLPQAAPEPEQPAVSRDARALCVRTAQQRSPPEGGGAGG